ncbi:MAG TPA: PBP1A family penicillin-binding protein, partial [Candidatus Binataceae bacterium]|nr:PBP1A family penicillin-binding protein [Candidatus Binataceae bacterium]
RVRTIAAVAFLVATFGAGFYLAELYIEISALIDERTAALTSTIYSAPAVIHRGDDLKRIRILDRLHRLSYFETATPNAPGEFARVGGAMWIYQRDFRNGLERSPARLVRISTRGDQVTGIADSFGVSMESAALEPEVIGRLLEGTPAERVDVQLNAIPDWLQRALLATEDRWFFYHPGIDPIRVIEAAINDLRSHRLRQGASTITQQLARTFMDRRERSFGRKIRELAVAIVIEVRLSKREILERYINDVPMGEYDGAPIEGMPLAARYYFNKDLREVSYAEGATLIGMIQAPSLYDPRRHPDLCRHRRDVVLAVMRRAKVIDDGAFAAATAAPIAIAETPGLRRAPYFSDYVTSFVRNLPGLNGKLRGLKVYTTLDTVWQGEAQDAMEKNLDRLERSYRGLRRRDPSERLQSAMVALDVETGAIRAMVGGRDYAQSQFNRATMAKRQPGSAFKPIVYLTAMDPERSPLSTPLTLASTLPDRLMSFNGWTPANYERTYHGDTTVVQALYESLNAPTAYVGNLVRPAAIVKTAHQLGITEDLPAVLPISIGAGETTLLELAGVYQVFAAMGARSQPYAVESIIDASGHQIYQHSAEANRVIDPSVAYVLTGGLENVLRYGTGATAERMGIRFPAAGKTGTTQDFKDAWFMGYTPEVVAGVWVGFDDPQSIGLTGAQAALAPWAEFMREVTPDNAPDFPEPSGIQMATIDPTTGGLATSACPRIIALPFLSGTAPTRQCPIHGGIFASSPIPSAPASTPPGAPPAAVASAPSSSSILGAVGNFFKSIFSH